MINNNDWELARVLLGVIGGMTALYFGSLGWFMTRTLSDLSKTLTDFRKQLREHEQRISDLEGFQAGYERARGWYDRVRERERPPEVDED